MDDINKEAQDLYIVDILNRLTESSSCLSGYHVHVVIQEYISARSREPLFSKSIYQLGTLCGILRIVLEEQKKDNSITGIIYGKEYEVEIIKQLYPKRATA
ncbi:MAG: hypothetical protein Q9223_002645 [Gallowayella weberi]